MPLRPKGETFTDNGNGTGTIATGAAGQYFINIEASNSQGVTFSSFSLKVK
jgi:hypothetical protein